MLVLVRFPCTASRHWRVSDELLVLMEGLLLLLRLLQWISRGATVVGRGGGVGRLWVPLLSAAGDLPIARRGCGQRLWSRDAAV